MRTQVSFPASSDADVDGRSQIALSGRVCSKSDFGMAGKLTRTGWAVLLVVIVVSFGYTTHELKRGWVPHDEGILAQSAERVLQGDLPHRDFVELYTGGLDYLHAMAFRMFGSNLVSLRIVVLIFFLGAVLAVFYIGSRLASPLAAGAVSLLAVTWGLPNYAAAMPSWYNLCLAIFAAAALFRYIETRWEGWIVLAGACCGLSLLVKLHGIFLFPAVLLFLAYDAQFAGEEAAAGEAPNRGYAAFVTVAGLAMVAALAMLVARKLIDGYYFLLPPAAVVGMLLWLEWSGNIRLRPRPLLALLRRSLLVVLGAAVPMAAFLIRYWASGSLMALVRGVFVAPAARVTNTAIDPPGYPWMFAGIAVAVLLVLLAYVRGRVGWLLGILVAILLACALQWATDSSDLYRAIWSSAATIIPATTLVVIALLLGIVKAKPLAAERQKMMLALAAITAMCSLVQFPFSAPVYFCYIAPLVVVTWLAILSCWEMPPRLLLGAVLMFYGTFAVLEVTPGFIYRMSWEYAPDLQTRALKTPRAGGLRVRKEGAEEYDQVIAAVRQHASGGFMYAAPYCPEIYFLAGLRNPRRAMSEGSDAGPDETATIVKSLREHNVNVVVLQLNDPAPDVPGGSGSAGVSPELHAALAGRFPHSTRLQRFEIRWRD